MEIKYFYLYINIIATWFGLAVQGQELYKEGVPGSYVLGQDGNYYLNTNNPETMWKGVWKEDTNGWRVQVERLGDVGENSLLAVQVGSVKFNSGQSYAESPSGKFAKFELVDSNGTIVQPKRGKSLEEHFSSKIPIHDFPRRSFDGMLMNTIAFFTNSSPSDLKIISFNDIYNIKAEADYMLTVSPVLFKYGTNAGFLDRLDLPCVTTKIHLRPNSLQ